MILKRNLFAFFVCISAFLASCQSGSETKSKAVATDSHKVTAREVIQTSYYTYVRASEQGSEYWIAINKSEVKEGNTYYWSNGAEMKDFTSKELNRTFPSIFFVQNFTDQPVAGTPQVPATSMAGRQQPQEYGGIVVPKAEGGFTIAELYANKNSLAGKKIKICGQVVKFSPGIMNKNWVHIQDGTKQEGNYDLAITTLDTLKVGDVVIFEGNLALNKDIGAGYFYDVLLEDARVKK